MIERVYFRFINKEKMNESLEMGSIAKLAKFPILTILCICGLTIELKIFEETCVSILDELCQDSN